MVLKSLYNIKEFDDVSEIMNKDCDIIGKKTFEVDKAFYTVIKMFEERGIPYWLEYGSLLGAIREKKRIEHDTDYDIGYPVKYSLQVLSLLENLPKEYSFIGVLAYGVQDHTGKKHYVCIMPHAVVDGKMYRVTGFGYWIILNFIRHKKSIKTFRFLFKCLNHLYMFKPLKVANKGDARDYKSFIKVKMGKVCCPIPIGYDNILKNLYGDDYMIPNADKSTCFKGGIGPEKWHKRNKK